MSQFLTGGCHCGAVRFRAKKPTSKVALNCTCSICSLSGGFGHIFIKHADFILETDWDQLTSYRFNSGQANHLFCKTCGVKSFYQPRSHPDAWSVSAYALDAGQIDDFAFEVFDGANWEKNVASIQ